MATIMPMDLSSGFRSDLESFVRNPVVITDRYGNPVNTFYINNDYKFNITFQEDALIQFVYFHDDVTDTDYMTYTLPPELKVQQTTVDHSPYPIFGESAAPELPKPIIGEYSIDIDGMIKAHFDDVDKYGNPALVFDEETGEYVLVNFIDFYTDANFVLEVSAQFRHVGSAQQIDFGNDVIVTVTVENPLPGTLALEKSALVSAIADKTVKYTVTITAENGPVAEIVLSDFEQPGSNGLLREAIFTDMTVSVKGAAAYTPPEFALLQGELFGDGFSLSFPSVTLNPNEQIVLEFTLDVADLIDDWVSEHSGDMGAYYFDIWLYNRATVEGEDEYGDKTPLLTSDNSANLSRKFLNKTGVQDLDHDYTAKWSNWSIGDGVTVLNQSTVTDALTGLLFGDNNILPNDENGVYLTFFGTDGIVASWYVPVAAGATGFSFVVPDTDEMVVTGMRPDGVYVQARGAHATQTLPYGEIVQVMIEGSFYTTVADESDFDERDTNIYANTITVEIDGDTPRTTVEIAVHRPGAVPSITKSGTFGGSGSEIEYVEWTVSYYVPRAACGQPVYFMDDLLMYIYGYDGLAPSDPRRLGVRNVPDNFVLKVYSENLGERELLRDVDYTLLDTEHNNGYFQARNLTTQWFLYFIGDTTGISWPELESKSVWPFADDTWVTITYQTPLDAIVDEGRNEILLKDAFRWAKGDFFSHVQNWIYGYNPIINKDAVATVRWGIRKSGIVSGDSITYKVEMRSEHVDLSDILTDVFDPLLEYVPFSMRIWKREAASTLYGPYEMVDSVFTDMLQSSISGNTMSFDFLEMYRIDWGAGGAEYFPDPTRLSDTAPAYESYVIEFQMRLKEDAPLGQHSVVNTVEINGFTGEWTTDIGTKIVEKSMSATSNIASVTILINPEEKTLDGIAGKYTVTDILSDTLAMYLSTMVVEAWEGDAWVTHPLVLSDSGDLWSYTTTGANQISFVVPDNTMLRVTYRALIKGDVGETVTIRNEVTVAGEYNDIVEEMFFISDTSGSCTGSRTTLTVLKNDRDTPETLLPGAIFALYIGVAYPGWETTKVPSGIERTITVGTMDFYYLASGTTSDIGRFVFDNPWLTPTHMAIYALEEYRAPIGYELPPEPVSLFAYTLPTETQRQALTPRGDDVQQISDIISISDTKMEDLSATIHGEKWVTGEHPPEKIFTFRLTQVADAGGSEMPEPHTDTTTTLGQGSFGFSLSNLLPDSTYYYKITEDVDAAATGWIFDPQAEGGHIVIVTIDENAVVTVLYPDDAESVTFTNHYLERANPTQILLSANKQAIGAELPCGKFAFGIFDGDDHLIETATNGVLDEN